jgi:cobalt-zinc-cadmium efflux system outer membrane protein
MAIAGATVAPGARADEAASPAGLTEQQAVARALARSSLADAIDGEVALEEGRGRTARTLPNPQLAWMREQTFGALGSGEDYLSISQVMDTGSRRHVQGQAGDARARAARREGEATRSALAAEVRVRFHAVLAHQERVAALDGWVARLDEALAIITRREQRGDAATYDLRRLTRERVVATARLETERAGLEHARGQLAGLLGDEAPEAGLQAAGALLPEDEPRGLAALRERTAARPDLVALGLRRDAALLERRAASRWWAPDLRLEGGWKGVDLGPQGRTDGFLVGASLAIPLWDRSEGAARAAEGEARAAAGRQALLASELQGELAGARARAVRLRAAAVAFREQAAATSEDLVRIATAGHAGGELGLLELLDAWRGAAEDLLTAVDLAHAARLARISLDQLTGAGLP